MQKSFFVKKLFTNLASAEWQLCIMNYALKNRILLAIDSFKNCMTSAEANDAAAEGVRDVCPDATIIKMPVSDGGEGWMDAFVAAMGGEIIEVEAFDPLMRPIMSQYAICDNTAIIEIAKASGIALLKPTELNPLKTNTYGTGQLVVDAIKNGCKKIIVGLGGSATSDCGIGMLTAIAENFAGGEITKIPDSQMLKAVNFTIATDVNNPLYGENGAAYIFAPQKGASPEMVKILDAQAKDFAEKMSAIFGYDCSQKHGAGAAGGLGYAFMQFLGAECRSGAELLFDAADFDTKIRDADLVITGEGAADSQTLMGKLPSAVLCRAQKFGVPVALIAGRVADREKLLAAGFRDVVCINPDGIAPEIAMQKNVAVNNVRETAKWLLKKR